MFNLLTLRLLWFFNIHIIKSSAYEVIYAVNAGGDAFTDLNNIHYEADPLDGRVGTASDFGTQLNIGRVPDWDAYLYQTERYDTRSFGYDIPIAGDGDYALVLKFCEVYFNEPYQKVFDVMLNGHTVVKKLDIFDEVGKGVAHDEIVYFTVSRGSLYFKEEESDIRSNRVRVEFIKSKRDNPKINAFVLFKDDLKNIPQLPPLDEVPNEINANNIDSNARLNDDVEEVTINNEPHEDKPRARKTSGPKHLDPYSMDSTVLLPVFIAIGAFIPLLFCLCKL